MSKNKSSISITQFFEMMQIGLLSTEMLSACLHAEMALNQLLPESEQRPLSAVCDQAFKAYVLKMYDTPLLRRVDEAAPAFKLLGEALDAQPNGGFTLTIPDFNQACESE